MVRERDSERRGSEADAIVFRHYLIGGKRRKFFFFFLPAGRGKRLMMGFPMTIEKP